MSDAIPVQPLLTVPLEVVDFWGGGRIHLVQVCHFDIGWLGSPEVDTRRRNEQINESIRLMAADPAYKWGHECVFYFRDWLKDNPGWEGELVSRIRDGRFSLGGTYTQPMEEAMYGELLIRQLYLGRKWFIERYPDTDLVTAMHDDGPLRALQMAQILQKAGIKYLKFSRFDPGFYRWGSPDGSSVLAWSQQGYWMSDKLDVPSILDKLVQSLPYYREHNLPPALILTDGWDDIPPRDFRKRIDEWNAFAGEHALPKMGYSNHQKAFEAIDKPGIRLVKFTGERPNRWLYENSPTHYEAIRYQREAGMWLPAAEAFHTFRSLMEGSFASYPESHLIKAWEDAEYACHTMPSPITDRIMTDKYRNARNYALGSFKSAATWIAERVKVDGEGTPMVVFNALGWQRTDTIVCDIPSSTPKSFWLRSSDGSAVKYQKTADGKLCFVAEDVPSYGYKTFYLVPDEHAGDLADTRVDKNWDAPFENDFYEIAPAFGGLRSIFDKQLGRELLDTQKFLGMEWIGLPFNGTGASEEPTIPVPEPTGYDRLKNYSPAWRLVESGPVRSVFETDEARTPHCRVQLRLIVYSNLKRLDLGVTLNGWDGTMGRENRLLLPLASRERDVAFEVPFGVVQVGKSEYKPEEGWILGPREVQNWVYGGGDGFGVTLSSCVGVCDWTDPTEKPVGNIVLSPVLLSPTHSCQGKPWPQKGDHSYRFSILSHETGWQHNRRPAVGSNMPLVAVFPQPNRKNAALPEEMSFCSVDSPNVDISALKKRQGESEVIIRLYETEGKESNVTVTFFKEIKAAFATDIIERDPKSIPCKDGRLSLKVGPCAIETVGFDAGTNRD